jgi:hypothetical protein
MAQAQIMYGLGQPDFTSIAGKFVYVEPLTFSLTGEGGEIISEKFVNGKKVIAGALQDGERYKLKVGIQAASFTALAWAHGEVTKTTSSIVLPEVREGRVPLTAPYEIVDADLATSAGAWAFQVDPIDTALTLSAIPAPAVGSFAIDVADTKLVFNAAQAGASIAYRVFKTFTNVRSIGQEPLAAAEILTQFRFGGIGYTDGKRVRIDIPKMSKISVPSMSLTEVNTLEVEYRLAVAAGQRSAYQLFEVN